MGHRFWVPLQYLCPCPEWNILLRWFVEANNANELSSWRDISECCRSTGVAEGWLSKGPASKPLYRPVALLALLQMPLMGNYHKSLTAYRTTP